MNEVLEFEGEVIRVLGTPDKPEWVAKDVCRVLGLENVSMAVSTLVEPDEKGISIIDTLGGKQQMVTLTEAGLYELMFSSNKPEAKRLRRWVTHDVLPALRKTGVFAVARDPVETMLESALETRRAQIRLAEQQEKFAVAVREVDDKADNAITKAEAAMFTVTGAPNYVALVGFAREHGIKMTEAQCSQEGRRFSKFLRDNGLPAPKQIPNQKYGTQNAYDRELLTEYWLPRLRDLYDHKPVFEDTGQRGVLFSS